MTLKAGVIGWPISHSKSPRIHGFWIEEYGLDATYETIALSPENFENGVRKLMSDGYQGANVTIPHKEAAFQLSDDLSERALKIGAVNTLLFKNGIILGDNTDGIGFLENLKQNAPDWNPVTGPSLVLGAGGAARAIVWALLDAGCPEVRIWNRTISRAEQLASDFGDRALVWRGSPEDACAGAITLVNTTSLGMTGQPKLEINITQLSPDALVTDIVYSPLQTELLAKAREQGYKVVDGLGMLLHQAIPGFEAWYGVRPKVTDDLRLAVLN